MSKKDFKPAKKLNKSQKQAWDKLTRKQKVFVNELLKDSTKSLTEASKVAYPEATYSTQRSMASRNTTNSNIATILDDHRLLAENQIVNTIKRYGNSESLEEVKEANRQAQYLHDKVAGKATQKVESTSVVMSIEDALKHLKTKYDS